MKKAITRKRFAAKAIIRNVAHEREILISNQYISEAKAEKGILAFTKYSAPAAGYEVVKAWIEVVDA